MRTLKKTLCVVLCLAMMVGLCVVGASAAFDDADKINYTEAVDVLTGIGVINGMGDGTFNPAGTLTRAQACSIIAKLQDAGDIKAKCTFDDVADDYWGASYIAYCAAEGIVNGVGDNKFDPEGKLTGSAWEKMLLCAIGFDAEKEAMTGDSWEVGVAKLAKAKGLNNAVKGLDAGSEIKREEACQIAFKALDVSVTGAATYTTAAGITFDSYIDAYLANGGVAATITVNTPQDSLHGTYFPGLVQTYTPDDFGRPASQWMYDDDGKAATPSIELYGKPTAAAKSFTVKAAAANAGNAAMLANINTALNLTGAKALAFAAAYEIYENGVLKGDTATPLAVVSPANDFQIGDEVSVYTNSAGAITTIAIVRYDLYQVTTLQDLTAAEKNAIKAKIDNGTASAVEKAATQKVRLTQVGGALSGWFYDSAIADFDYEKDTYILAAGVTDTGVGAIATNNILGTKAADLVSGKVSAYKGVDDVQIGGTWYKLGGAQAGTAAAKVNLEYTFAKNEAGRLEGIVAAPVATSTDYALVYMIKEKTATISDDGIAAGAGANTYTAYVVLQDGTKANYPLAVTVGAAATDGTITVKNLAAKVLRNPSGALPANAYGTKTALVDTDLIGAGTAFVMPYSINAKGQIEAAVAPAGTAVEAAAAVTAVRVYKSMAVPTLHGLYLTNNTEFIFSAASGTTMTVSKKTGYKNVDIPAAGFNVICVSNVKNEITHAFVLGQDPGVVSTANIAVLLSATPVETKSAGITTYTYDVAIDGKATTLASVGAAIANVANGTITAGGVFSYQIDGDGAVTADTKLANYPADYTAVTYVGEDYFMVGGTKHEAAKATFYTITKDTTTVPAGVFSVASSTFGDVHIANPTAGIAASDVYCYYASPTAAPIVFIGVQIP